MGWMSEEEGNGGMSDTRKHDSGISGITSILDILRRREEEMEVGDTGRYGKMEAEGEFRLAWMWVEGWRARLRKGGDIVERERHVWDVVKAN